MSEKLGIGERNHVEEERPVQKRSTKGKRLHRKACANQEKSSVTSGRKRRSLGKLPPNRRRSCYRRVWGRENRFRQRRAEKKKTVVGPRGGITEHPHAEKDGAHDELVEKTREKKGAKRGSDAVVRPSSRRGFLKEKEGRSFRSKKRRSHSLQV